jgi:hypothetical protein
MRDCQDVRVPRSLLIPFLLAPLLFAACGEDDVATPTACLEGPAKIETALVTAPDAVLIDGRVPISDCLVGNQPQGEMINFGRGAVAAATRLGKDAGKSGPVAINAAIRAGYLVGAMEKAAEQSDGIHTALVDRVTSAATYRLERAGEGTRIHYEAGLEAGRKTG